MATAKKLPSGAYRCLVYIGNNEKGKRQYKSFTAATKKEAELLASQFLNGNNTTLSDMTVAQCIDGFIKSKEKTISTTTLRAYLSMQKNSFEEISNKKVKMLNSSDLQRWIGNLNRSPKTVKNIYSLLTASIGMFYPDKSFRIKLPQQMPNDLYVPTDEDVKKIIKYFENDIDMTIAIYLAAFGTLRRSEACGLTAQDVNRKTNTIHVHTTTVMKHDSREFIEKTETKNPTSNRYIEMPKFVIDILPTEGKLINITPAVVSHRFDNAFLKTGMKKFRFHDLRHYSASVMHAINVPDVYIMQRGGWSSDATLKKIYRGSMDDYQKKFTDITNRHFESMQHEMQHENEKAP